MRFEIAEVPIHKRPPMPQAVNCPSLPNRGYTPTSVIHACTTGSVNTQMTSLSQTGRPPILISVSSSLGHGRSHSMVILADRDFALYFGIFPARSVKWVNVMRHRNTVWPVTHWKAQIPATLHNAPNFPQINPGAPSQDQSGQNLDDPHFFGERGYLLPIAAGNSGGETYKLCLGLLFYEPLVG